MTSLEKELDQIKLNAFISVLKADRVLYQRRIAIKKEKGENTEIEEAILNRTVAQLSLLGVSYDD